MKLILCSVLLAHSAVVYTVCAPFSGGVCQLANQNRVNNLNVCVIPEVRVAICPGPHASSHNKKEHPAHSTHLLNSSKRPKIPACALRTQPGRHKCESYVPSGVQNGWRMSSDLSIDTSNDITIHFTIDAHGQIKNVAVTPFTSSLYQTVCDQLKQIHFTWHGTSPPPLKTLFEKKICLR